jgi:hypothetical protein
MKGSVIALVSSIIIAAASFVASHSDIHTFGDLLGNVQNFFGLLGIIGGVVLSWFSKSPMGNGVK